MQGTVADGAEEVTENCNGLHLINDSQQPGLVAFEDCPLHLEEDLERIKGVCVREIERQSERQSERDRETESQRERDREREREHQTEQKIII